MTLAELIARTERRLRRARLSYGHGTENARDEAAFLVIRGLGLPFDADPQAAVDARRVEKLVVRRIEEHIPTAYLLNEAWLSGTRFYVDRRAIVPRSHIASLLADRLRPWLIRSPRRILDLCTGSGCLATLAAFAFPHARVDASDLSSAALAVARRNVELHRLKRRVRLIKSDLFGRLEAERYGLILCNPPYVPSATMRRLPPEYRYEPGLALAAGRDGLDVVARLLGEARRHMARHALLVCEVGDRRRAIERRFSRLPFVWPKDEVFLLERAALDARGLG